MKTRALQRLAAVVCLAVLVSGCCFLHSFWRQGVRPLTYYTHASIPGHWIGAINAAHGTWNLFYNVFNYGGGGGGGTYQNDGVNSIFMFFFGNPTYLAAVDFPGSSGCHLLDTDMGWNTVVGFNTNGLDFDVQTVALHEFGHYGILEHVICPSNAVMYPAYHGLQRTTRGCDAFGWFVSNALPPCFPAMGICFPSFFLFKAFDSQDQEDQETVGPFERHSDELIQIWDGNANLRAASDSVGEFYAEVAQDWENGHSSPYTEVFDWNRYSQMDAEIIAPVYASASWALRSDLDNLRAHLQSKVGLTFAQLFGGDIGPYPGNPAEPIEPDPDPGTCYACGGGGGGGGEEECGMQRVCEEEENH